MNERIRELAVQAGIATNLETDFFEKDANKWVDYYSIKFAELIIEDYARKAVLGWMADPAFVQAMDEYYEQKWAYRFD